MMLIAIAIALNCIALPRRGCKKHSLWALEDSPNIHNAHNLAACGSAAQPHKSNLIKNKKETAAKKITGNALSVSKRKPRNALSKWFNKGRHNKQTTLEKSGLMNQWG